METKEFVILMKVIVNRASLLQNILLIQTPRHAQTRILEESADFDTQ
jgi:hypothetical protein